MSYDYILVRGKAGAEDLAEMVEGWDSQPIGTVESIQAAISALFPTVRWQRGPIPDLTAWFGSSEVAEFQLIAGGNGDVTMLSMSRCERTVVERVAKELGLVAVDEQSLERFGGKDL